MQASAQACAAEATSNHRVQEPDPGPVVIVSQQSLVQGQSLLKWDGLDV